MPKIKSAIKRVEIAERNRTRNKAWKSAIRTGRNQVTDALKGADLTGAEAALRNAYSLIDTAVTKGCLHKNTAARRKARLAQQLLKFSSKTGK